MGTVVVFELVSLAVEGNGPDNVVRSAVFPADGAHYVDLMAEVLTLTGPSGNPDVDFLLQGSNDGTAWVDIGSPLNVTTEETAHSGWTLRFPRWRFQSTVTPYTLGAGETGYASFRAVANLVRP